MNEKLTKLWEEVRHTDYENIDQVRAHMQQAEAFYPEMLTVDEKSSYQDLIMMVNRIYRSMKAKAEHAAS
jgi:hypothetical protein